ncbi:MAG: hypothetical protein ACP5O1_02420, partial [Phycisphaerae bacterium]
MKSHRHQQQIVPNRERSKPAEVPVEAKQAGEAEAKRTEPVAMLAFPHGDVSGRVCVNRFTP